MGAHYPKGDKVGAGESAGSQTCNHYGKGVVLHFDPTMRRWICHACLLKIRKDRMHVSVEKRRASLRKIGNIHP